MSLHLSNVSTFFPAKFWPPTVLDRNMMLALREIRIFIQYTTRTFNYDVKELDSAYGWLTWLEKRVNVSINADTAGIPNQDY